MTTNGLIQCVQSIDIADLVNYTKDELTDRFGKDFAMMQGYSQNNPASLL